MIDRYREREILRETDGDRVKCGEKTLRERPSERQREREEDL
jgi:hypothetical protein